MTRPWLALRAFGGVGGNAGARLGAGMGLALGPVALDLGVRTWGTLNALAPRGLGLSLGLAVESWRGPYRGA